MAFPIDANTGVLGAPTTIASPQPPFTQLTLDGTKFLYLAQLFTAQGTGQISGYTIDQTTGALAAMLSSPFSAPGAFSLNTGTVIDNFLYIGGISFLGAGIAPTVNAFSIGSDGSLLSTIAGSPFDAAPPGSIGAGFGPSVVSQSQFLYATEYEGSSGQPGGVSAFSINPSTGVLTPVAGSPFSTGPIGSPTHVVSDSARGPFVYVALSNPPSFQDLIAAFSVDQTTGALTPLPGSPFNAASTVATLALDPSGQFLFTGNAKGGIVEFKVGSDGTLTLLPATGASAAPPFVFFGKFLYGAIFTNGIAGFEIDETTGALTPIGSPFPSTDFVRSMVAVTLPSHP
jgi:6-phosphogluconolactonase (cycloisomerase 2 family)